MVEKNYYVAPTTVGEAYPLTMVALTAPMRFVEWKALRVKSQYTPNWGEDDWNPIVPAANERDWLKDEKSHAYEGSYKEIDGPKWLYVFAREEGAPGDRVALVEELFLEALPDSDKGNAFGATKRKGPRHTIVSHRTGPFGFKAGANPKRPSGKSIGPTIRFCRRFRGKQLVYYFFATRIRLEEKHVERLRQRVAFWGPGVSFEASDPKQRAKEKTFGAQDRNIVGTEDDGSLLVPVLDPLTIARHLHAFYMAATRDMFAYVAPENEDAAVTNRQNTALLAQLVKLIVDRSPERAGDLDSDKVVDAWIEHYQAQVDFRATRRDMWTTYLWRWLAAEPLRFLKDAHSGNSDDLLIYVTPIIMCFEGAHETKPGREILKAVWQDTDRWQFVLDILFPEKSKVPTVFKAGRKLYQAWAEAGKAMLIQKFVFESGDVVGFQKLMRWADIEGGGPLKVNGQVVTSAEDAAAKWQARKAPPGKNNSVERRMLSQEGEEKLTARWTNVKLLLTSINVGVALFKMAEDPSFNNRLSTVSATTSLASTVLLDYAKVLDPSLALTTAAKKGDEAAIKAVAAAKVSKELAKKTLTTVTAVLDMIVSARAALQADDIDRAAKTGNLIKFSGSGIFLVGTLLSESPAVIIGLVLIGIGTIIELFKKDKLALALGHTYFGEAPKGTAEEQLRHLVDLLCEIVIEPAMPPAVGGMPGLTWFQAAKHTLDEARVASRKATLKTGWVPPGSAIELEYAETWQESGRDVSHMLYETVHLSDDGTAPPVHLDKIVVPTATLSGKVPTLTFLATHGTHGTGLRKDIVGWPGDAYESHADFRHNRLKVRLLVTIGGVSFQVPSGKDKYFEEQLAFR